MIQILLVYITGLLQGVVMVMVPACGALLTNGQYHDLTPSEYGALFVPMIFGAIGASVAAGNMAVRRGLRYVYFVGLVLNFISMALFASTNWLMSDHLADYALLLISLLFLGMGFGSTLTTLNTYAATLFPKCTSTAMTALHALLGTGTAIAPLLLTAYLSIHLWWGAPATVALSFVLLFFIAIPVMERPAAAVSKPTPPHLPPIFWLFAAFTCLYGLSETVFGNWATIYLTTEKNLTMTTAALALAFFWGAVTLGRLIVSASSFVLSPRRIFVVLPLLIACAFFVVPEASGAAASIGAYAFAGAACSACFPLSISFGEQRFREAASIASGRMTAAYMAGYGIAAYGVGVFHEWFDFSLQSIYFAAAVPALLAWAVVLYLWHRRMLA